MKKDMGVLASGDGRDEYEGIVVFEGGIPGCEVFVDGDLEIALREGEAVAGLKLLVEFGGSGGGRFEGFGVEAALVFEEGEVFDIDFHGSECLRRRKVSLLAGFQTIGAWQACLRWRGVRGIFARGDARLSICGRRRWGGRFWVGVVG